MFGGDGALVALAPGEQQSARAALSAAADVEHGAARARAARRARPGRRRARRWSRRARGALPRVRRGGLRDVLRRRRELGRPRDEGRALPRARRRRPGAQPDLTGLSCRFLPMRARSGAILSIIAVPREDADPAAFGALVAQLVELLATQDRGGHPVPVGGPHATWPPPSAGAGGAHPGAAPRATARPRAGPRAVAAFRVVSDRTGRAIGGFDAREHYADAEPERRLPQVRRRAEADGRRARGGLRADRGICSPRPRATASAATAPTARTRR